VRVSCTQRRPARFSACRNTCGQLQRRVRRACRGIRVGNCPTG
jgi:hypothetical protein